MFTELSRGFFLSTQCTVTHHMWDLASQCAVKSPFSPGCRHASTISTGSDYMNLNWLQFDTSVDPRWLLSLKGKWQDPAGLRMGSKEPRREQLLETSPANSPTWIKTLARGELRQGGLLPRPGSSQSFQRWQRSIDGWTNCPGLCTQLKAHCYH